MNIIDSIMTKITDPGILDQLATLLREHDPEFPEIESRYQRAVQLLREDLVNQSDLNFEEYLSACQTEVTANLLYAAYLGYRANLDNFHSPYMTRFEQLDFTDYIRDHLMGNFPVCREANQIKERFQQALPEIYEDADNAITEYFIALDVSGPKLAHYAGYLLANQFLGWVEPGYRVDFHQTSRYQEQMRQYLGLLPF